MKNDIEDEQDSFNWNSQYETDITNNCLWNKNGEYEAAVAGSIEWLKTATPEQLEFMQIFNEQLTKEIDNEIITELKKYTTHKRHNT